MDDRELLERAARAAGFGAPGSGGVCWTESEYPRGSGRNGALWNYVGYMDSAELWNSLSCDGDALRLAVKLGFIVVVDEEMEWVGIHFSGKLGKYDWVEKFGECRFAAARRAITCAAAELACEKAK